MPRIEKVRITGVRYDKMKKHYENTIFDFMNEEEPQHALLTLVNGGGKGMLLQMMFQALLPLTTWGKNGENHIHALFYNEKGQFDPYTFHVALEWRLDTDPAEWLVTGICITARKFAGENDDVDTEPLYFLYTSKYRKPEEWTIDTLPLYDEQKKQTLSFDDWENWLKKHKQQFQIYSKSKQNAYYQYLSTYGIEKIEWKHMKEINRDEGGIEHYFKKGLDNFGLFHNLIIPEISSYLEEDQEENLLRIFRDNSIIAEKLPKLLKREEAYQLINEKLNPVKAALEEGEGLESEIVEHLDRANYLYFGMEEQKETYQYELDKWEEEKQKTEKLQADFLWQKDNLEFAKECRSYEKVSSEIVTSEEKIKQLSTDLDVLKVDKHDIEVEIALTDYLESSEKLKAIQSRIEYLENAENLLEEKEQIKQLEQRLEEKWILIESELIEDIRRFQTLENSLQNELAANKSFQNINTVELNKIRARLGTYTEFIKGHNQKAISMQQKYGKDINRDPESVHKRVVKENDDLKESIQQLRQEIDLLQNRKVQIGKSMGVLDGELKGRNSELLKHQANMNKQSDLEKAFHKRWCRYYQKDEEFAYFSTEEFTDIADGLMTEKGRLQTHHENVQKDYWYHQLDTSLVNDEYWIANNDVRKLVEKLNEMGITVIYGTQLILEYSKEERLGLMEKFPLLAYGIVVHEHDWDMRRVDHRELEMMFVHAPVPIFIRERMNVDFKKPFEIIREQGVSMAFFKEQWESWKENLTILTDNYLTDLDKLQAKLGEVDMLLETVKVLQSSNYSRLLEEEKVLMQVISNLEQQKVELQTEESETQSQLKKLRDNEKDDTKKQEALQKRLYDIESWVNEHTKFTEYQKLKAEALIKERDLDKRLQELLQQFENLETHLKDWRDSYGQWKVEMVYQTKLLMEILPSVQFPTGNTTDKDESRTPVLRKMIFDDVTPIMKDWQKLQQKILSTTSELASEKTKQEFQTNDAQQKREVLNQLEEKWADRKTPTLPKAMLLEQLKGKKEQIQQIEIKCNDLNGSIRELTGQLKQIKRNKESQEKRILERHHRSAEAWLDTNIEEKEALIEQALLKIQEDLTAQHKIIKKLGSDQQHLQKQEDILKSHVANFRQVGEIPTSIKEQLRVDTELPIRQWISRNNELTKEKEGYQRNFKDRLKDLRESLQDEKIDAPLRQSLHQLIPQLESDSIRSGLTVISSVMEYIQNELNELKEDKQKAENAQEIWVDRAVMRVIRIFQSLKQMVNRMKIKNKEGHMFPLVEIVGLKEIETTKEEDFRRLLREHFTQTIEKLLESKQSIENLSDNELKKYINDSQLVLISLRNRYPVLNIYKPQTTNAFLYERPRKHHYTTWETLNKGSKTEAKGSGGQLLAARTIIMMMIMTFKRQEHSTNWSVLITDNPFGQAVSAHILDPIFSIADILRFQWIVLAPPELIKLDVSRRFPVYWKLELSQKNQGEIIKEVLQHGGRTFEEFELGLF